MVYFKYLLISDYKIILPERLSFLFELSLTIETLSTPKRTMKRSESHILVAEGDSPTPVFAAALTSYSSQGELRHWLGRLRKSLGSATFASGDRASQLPALIKVLFCGPSSSDLPHWLSKLWVGS